jgi:predicted RNase H-like HicB family nuclease
MSLTLTAVFKQVPEGYVAFIEEVPGSNTQGDTLEEARANLREALALVLKANRTLIEQALGDAPVIREQLRLTAA